MKLRALGDPSWLDERSGNGTGSETPIAAEEEAVGSVVGAGEGQLHVAGRGGKEASSSRFHQSSLLLPGALHVQGRRAKLLEGTACSRGTSRASQERRGGVWFERREGGGLRVLRGEQEFEVNLSLQLLELESNGTHPELCYPRQHRCASCSPWFLRLRCLRPRTR